MSFLKRNRYLNQLIELNNTPDIKVITGIRRAGKSVLIDEYASYLSDNISDENTFKREYTPLLSIKDAYPKMIIARTRHEEYDYQGIKVCDLAHWLINSKAQIRLPQPVESTCKMQVLIFLSGCKHALIIGKARSKISP